jgi:hypothetical protein
MNNFENKIKAFLADVGEDFFNRNSASIVQKEDIDMDTYAEYLKTGYKHMYFEDYFCIGDGLEELIEEQDEVVMEFIRENY